MSSAIDLRDLDGEEREEWEAAIDDQIGWATFDQIADNAIAMVPEDEWDEYVRADLEGLCEIPDFLEPYIDWDAWIASIDYTTIEVDGSTYRFHTF